MDELLEIMKTRRSIRRYKKKDVPDELLEKIKRREDETAALRKAVPLMRAEIARLKADYIKMGELWKKANIRLMDLGVGEAVLDEASQ